MSMLSGSLLEPATGFAGSSMTMASLLGFVCAFTASDHWSSSVYCSKVPDDRAVVNSTALTGHGRGHVTCLAASFHVLPVMAFYDCRLANGLMTSGMHSEVRPAFLLSQWRIMTSSSVALFHLGHAVGAHNHIQPSLLFSNLYWLSVSISYGPGALNVSQNLILRHEPCLLVLPFSTTARNLHLVDLKCCQAPAWLLEDTQPCSLTRFASYWLILSQYLVVSQTGWVGTHELVLLVL